MDRRHLNSGAGLSGAISLGSQTFTEDKNIEDRRSKDLQNSTNTVWQLILGIFGSFDQNPDIVMTVKLYGAAHSTCTRRVMVVLEEKEVPYKLIPINLGKGEQAMPEFRATKQPFGKVPVLDDDGFLIYESRAICKYIAKRWTDQGTKLIPDDNDARAYGMFEQVRIISGNEGNLKK